MNAPEPKRWQLRALAARGDTPPPVDVAALLRLVRRAAAEPAAGWRAELAALLTAAPMAAVCGAGLTLLAGIGMWQLWTIWELLPWIELTAGGGGAR